MSEPKAASLRDAWKAEPAASRRVIAKTVEQGKPLRTHRDATLGVWLGVRQLKRGPYVAGATFVVLAVLFAGLRVFLEGSSWLEAFADPQVYVIAGLAALLQLFLFNRQVKQRFRRGVAVNVAKLEGRSPKAPDLDVDALVARAREDGWLAQRWARVGR
ncbi:MAG: hypothetical protein H0V93_13120 [Euzebyales bacterium]|nr:hypothetical protein [Euzebyales bacterium]